MSFSPFVLGTSCAIKKLRARLYGAGFLRPPPSVGRRLSSHTLTSPSSGGVGPRAELEEPTPSLTYLYRRITTQESCARGFYIRARLPFGNCSRSETSLGNCFSLAPAHKSRHSPLFTLYIC